MQDRMSNSSNSSFDGSVTAVGTQYNSENCNPGTAVIQPLLPQERRKHDRKNLARSRFYKDGIVPDTNTKLVIQKTLKMLFDAIRFKLKSRKELRGLPEEEFARYKHIHGLFKNPALGALFNHVTSTGEMRRSRRSDGIEAMLQLVLADIIFHCDLTSMAYGVRDSRGRQVFYSFATIAKNTGLTPRRVNSAITKLKKLDIIKVKAILNTDEKKRKIWTDVEIHLSSDIFAMFGEITQFNKDRLYCQAKIATKQAKINSREERERMLQLATSHRNDRRKKELMAKLSHGWGKPPAAPKQPTKPTQPADPQQAMADLRHLLAQGMSISDATKLLLQRRNNTDPPH